MAMVENEASRGYFGKDFEINPQNRLSPLKPDSQTGELPEFVKFGRDIRMALRGTLREGNTSEGEPVEQWPELPKGIEDAVDLFEKADDAVTGHWKESAQELVGQKCREWLSEIPDTEKTEVLRKILSDPELLETKLEINQFQALEGLRTVHPEAWLSLLMAASERQLASVAVSRHWIRELPEDVLNGFGFLRNELLLITNLTGLSGKYIDQAYFKQVELAVQPGGTSETALSGLDGAERVYDIYTSEPFETENVELMDSEKGQVGEEHTVDSSSESGVVNLVPYAEVFPFEWSKLVSRISYLSGTVQADVDAGRLPETYRKLPEFLNHMAEAYGSDEVDIKTLDDMWEELSKEGAQLALDGCPISMYVQNSAAVAGDAAKIDAEVRIGIRTDAIKKLEARYQQLGGIVESYNQGYQDKLMEKVEVPTILLDSLVFAGGSNLFGMTRGEGGDGLSTSHVNAIRDVAMTTEIPLLNKIMNIQVESEVYEQGAVNETVLHELGHLVLPSQDEAILTRIGTGDAANVVEEIKGECVGMKILLESQERGIMDWNMDLQLLAKVGTNLDYLINKSADPGSGGKRYRDCAVVVLSTLLRAQAIEEHEGGYAIKDSEKGISALAAVGEKILGLYADESTSPETVVSFYNQVIAEAEGTDEVDRLLQRALHG